MKELPFVGKLSSKVQEKLENQADPKQPLTHHCPSARESPVFLHSKWLTGVVLYQIQSA